MKFPILKKAAVFLFFSPFLFIKCDSRKEPLTLENSIENLLCYGYSICTEHPRGTEFGMIGDSWTDIMGGMPLVWSIRTYMELQYGYRLTAATLAGRTMENVLMGGLHYYVIDRAGPDLRYMILSLGGNDLLFNYPLYSVTQPEEKQALIDIIRSRLLGIVRSGNAYKKQRWGGGDLIWIIHGYDYLNPDKSTSLLISNCRSTFLGYGYPSAEIIPDLVDSIDRLNQAYLNATYEEPSLRYVNLRGTLGGPLVSDPPLMLDCIHPNTVGFSLITSNLVFNLDYITGHAR